MIDLAKINKYVGYKGQHLTVDIDKMIAGVKMLALKENGEWKGFPDREIVINRVTAQLSVITGNFSQRESKYEGA